MKPPLPTRVRARREREGKEPHVEIKESPSYCLICAKVKSTELPHTIAHPAPANGPFSHILIQDSKFIQETFTDTYFKLSRTSECSVLSVKQIREVWHPCPEGVYFIIEINWLSIKVMHFWENLTMEHIQGFSSFKISNDKIRENAFFFLKIGEITF